MRQCQCSAYPIEPAPPHTQRCRSMHCRHRSPTCSAASLALVHERLKWCGLRAQEKKNILFQKKTYIYNQYSNICVARYSWATAASLHRNMAELQWFWCRIITTCTHRMPGMLRLMACSPFPLSLIEALIKATTKTCSVNHNTLASCSIHSCAKRFRSVSLRILHCDSKY